MSKIYRHHYHHRHYITTKQAKENSYPLGIRKQASHSTYFPWFWLGWFIKCSLMALHELDGFLVKAIIFPLKLFESPKTSRRIYNSAATTEQYTKRMHGSMNITQ